MHFKRTYIFLLVVAASLFSTSAYAQRGRQPQLMAVVPDHTNGVYRVGDVVHWRIEWRGSVTSAPPTALHYTLWKGEITDAGQGDLTFTNGATTLDTKLEQPGHIMLEVRTGTAGGRGGRALGGVLASPEKIIPSAPMPGDFAAFWKTKLKELHKIPANPQLEKVDVGNTNIQYWKITMDNIGGSHIYGQLARPVQGKKFPALLILQWAGGPYALDKSWVTERAKQGWLVLNIEPHDMPIDALDKSKVPQGWESFGNDDREKSYFLRMYLSCYRAAEYLAGRPDWNGKVLVAAGDSMGGQQSLMLAGLYPKMTAVLALVPSGADTLGPEAGRKGGFPQWYDQTQGKDAAKVHEASRYFDTVNFASNIKCPVMVAMGLLDETSPPTGIFAALNQIKSPKEILILANSPHQDANGSQAPYRNRRDNDWLPALREGKTPPINTSR